ncbi:hypothetical protein [Streptomyces goshikiensis]|uniref:hypothetical protein n=1 Tax=Streptomyces goshikiensis TaxID=1942 RepID=UPI0036537EC7
MDDETWTSDEFGSSHEGRVGVLLADGKVPKPVYFDGSSGTGRDVRHWSVYDGGTPLSQRPRAAVLHAECACGWTGPHRTIDETVASDRPFLEAGADAADRCVDDWDRHIAHVGDTTVPLPTELEILLENVTAAIEALTQESPIAAIKAARRLEVIAQRTAHWPSHKAREHEPETVAAALGLNIKQTRTLLARFGGWSPYS